MFAIFPEKFDVKVSFRLKLPYIVLGGGGSRIVLIHFAIASYQLRVLNSVVNRTEDNNIKTQWGEVLEALTVIFTCTDITSEKSTLLKVQNLNTHHYMIKKSKILEFR